MSYGLTLDLNLDLTLDQVFKGAKLAKTQHDQEHAEVMSEQAEDYYPGANVFAVIEEMDNE